jgi:fucose 4-O-acetylase-like acetyltransferase
LERKKFIDIAKGIGIIAVVAGHLFFWLPVPESYPSFLHFVHSFHMPLFFILAGVTFKIAKEAPVKKYI